MAQLDEGTNGANAEIERVDDTDGVPVVALIGEIDISNADVIGEQLVRLVAGSDVCVIDVQRLAFMDSAGIAMLLRTSAHVGNVRIRKPSDVVRRIIECTGLADVLRIEQV